MPPVLAAAAITAGAGIFSAVSASNAAGRANRAQQQAAQQQLAAQQAALDRVQGLQQPFITGGGVGFDALLRELGLTSPAGGNAPRAPAPALSYDAAGNVRAAPLAQPAGGTVKPYGGFAGTSPLEPPPIQPSPVAGKDAAREVGRPAPVTEAAQPAPPAGPSDYFTANPDVAESYEAYKRGDASRPGETFQDWGYGANLTPEQFAQKHYEIAGKTEGRAPPPQPGAQAVQTDPNAPPDLTSAARPGAALAPDFERGPDVQMGDYGSAPDLASFFSNFEQDPGAAFRKSEALNGVNAYSAARGKLRSGDAAKALMGRASDLASQEYGNWFNRQMAKFNASRGAFENDRSFEGNMWTTRQGRNDRNFGDDRAYDTGMWQFGVDRGDTNFNIDRGYQTDRGNDRIANLFDVTRIGTGAAGSVGGAAQNFANNSSAIYGNQADAAGDAAYSRAASNAYGVNSAASAGADLFARWGGGSTSSIMPGEWDRSGGTGYRGDLGRVNMSGTTNPFNYGSVRF